MRRQPITLFPTPSNEPSRPQEHWRAAMYRDLLDAIDKARNLICTPLALEVLDDLAHGRSPYKRSRRSNIITAAVRYLESLGAARVLSLQAGTGVPVVEITPCGQTLYDRLVEIEEWAARHEAVSGSLAGGST